MRLLRTIIPAALLMSGLLGCKPTPPPPPDGGKMPATLPMSEVVRQINANNSRLASFWAQGTFEATLPDQPFLVGTVRILYRRPDEIRIVGIKEPFIPAFDIGTNSEKYWLIAGGDDKDSRMWWGDISPGAEALKRATPASPGEPQGAQIPIQPELLLQVLGVGALNPDLLAQPIPAMRYNPDSDAYMFTWHVLADDRWIVQREVWYDRKTLLPRNVLLFDDNGRIVLRAYLGLHKPVTSGNDDATGPKVATAYDLYFPETKAKLTFRLRDIERKHDGAPNDATFRFPAERAAGDRVMRLSSAGGASLRKPWDSSGLPAAFGTDARASKTARVATR